MTDVASLTAGPELDRLIAERVMGWTVHHADTATFETGGLPRRHIADWRPSTDIAQAWEVVERLAKAHCFHLALGHCTDGAGLAFADEHGCYWDAVFDDVAAHDSGSGLAPIAAEAICQAALLAMRLLTPAVR